MKPKKVAILMSITNTGVDQSGEFMFHKIIKDMVEEGRTIKTIQPSYAVFSDDSIVQKISFAQGAIGRRYTHLYIDKSILNLKNGKEYVEEVLLPCIVNTENINYKHLDADEKALDRVFTFENNVIEKLDRSNK